MKLGSVIRKYRLSRDVTVRTLAKEMGISFPTLSRIENGGGCDASVLVRLLVWFTSPEAK